MRVIEVKDPVSVHSCLWGLSDNCRIVGTEGEGVCYFLDDSSGFPHSKVEVVYEIASNGLERQVINDSISYFETQ